MAFGVPGGGPNLDVVGAFADQNIDFVLAHTETAACIMASTWGWLRDSVSAAVVTRGPGAASAVNGAAQATLDRQPLLLVTDTVPSANRDRVPHQRIDQAAMLAPVSKASLIAGSGTTVTDVSAAARFAMEWPSGCVHLDYDASHAGSPSLEKAGPAERTETRDPSRLAGATPDPASVEEARALVAGAIRPVVIVGVGAVRDAADVARALDEFGAPVLTTYQGVGIITSEHRCFGGLFTNGASERPLLERADLIIMIGVDFVEPIPATWNYDAPVLSIASLPTTDPYLEPHVEVVGELADIVPLLVTGSHQWSPTHGQEHNRAVQAALARGAASDIFGPVALTQALGDLVPGEATVTVDAGAHFLAIMPFWNVVRPRQLLISNGLATMGYAVPAAIGAAMANPQDSVVALTGDGGLGMCLAELETIARRRLPITVVVFNDATLSLIQIKKQPHHGDERSVRYGATDFAALSEAMGLPGIVVRDVGELRAALTHHDHRSPLLIDARIDPSSYAHLIAVTRG